jgi:polyferredoxin
MPSAAAALLAAGLLTITKIMAPYDMLIADRFLPGAGWLEIVLLSGYAAWLHRRFITSSTTARLRITVWLAFSIVFFSQFMLGVAGIDRFLMTGTLHVPVPAAVIGGPLYRGSRFFMPLLFVVTILLSGPAWCSHLCYVGAWDGLLARRKKLATPLSPGWNRLRIWLFIATPVVAIVLRVTAAGNTTATLIAVAFGIAGLLVMALLSTRRGTMVHCTSICPLGMAGNLLGRVSPFRLRIDDTCSACMQCTAVCRYNALQRRHIERRKPGYTCTLCGDCIAACKAGAIHISFFKVANARAIFLVIVVALHAVFLGVARI